MRTLLPILLLCISIASFSQDREFPDFRSKKETFLRVQEKDVRADLASFTMGGMDESVGKGKLFNIPATNYGNDFITFSGSDIQVTIKAGTFDKTKHKLQMFQNKYLVRIDGKPYFGNYGDVPTTTIQSITVLVGKDTVAIPAAAYADLYEPDFTYRDGAGTVKSYNKVYLSPDNKRIYIYMLNRDPYGSYEVTWVIQDKQYLRRVVDFGFLKQ
ncbi:MAG TPA: hypothetical protein VD996_10550 [Chitinophagaceae bacterium]|nr:hypothetical protein [Chitinophagaceae bacterium]